MVFRMECRLSDTNLFLFLQYVVGCKSRNRLSKIKRNFKIFIDKKLFGCHNSTQDNGFRKKLTLIELKFCVIG